MFSSPAIAGDVVFIGVLNGTLQARDLKTGEVLWNFETETSKQNKGWVLTKDRAFNDPLLYHSNWREAPLSASRSNSASAEFTPPRWSPTAWSISAAPTAISMPSNKMNFAESKRPGRGIQSARRDGGPEVDRTSLDQTSTY